MQSIVVVGAGISGLYAASKLSSKKNNKVFLIEASNYLGGRIRTFNDKTFSMPVECGAEFIHGKLPVTLKLLKKAGIRYHEIGGRMFYLNQGKFEPADSGVKEWNLLMKRMKLLKHDMPLSTFLKENFAQKKYDALRNYVINFAEGFDLADVSKASTKSLYSEWSAEDDVQYRIDGGYVTLISYLQSECKNNNCEIVKNSPVKKINWEKNRVEVEITSGKVVIANKILITVPLSVLQADENSGSRIVFSPSINKQINAAKNIGFGGVIKIILKFDEAFWQNKKENVGFVFTKEKVPTWWTQLPNKNAIITGWLGGSKAIECKHASDEEILLIALQSLALAFHLSVENLKEKLKAYKVVNWFKTPNISGAYSYNFVGSAKAKKFLQQPVDNTLFFAGEATYEGESEGTVEAALISAKNAIHKMKH